jgi:hypothetical protein
MIRNILLTIQKVIRGRHCVVIYKTGLLVCCIMWLGNLSPTFRRNLRPSTSDLWINSQTHNYEDQGGRLLRNVGKQLKKAKGATTQDTCLTLILLMWRIGWANSIPIYIQQYATLHSLFISGNCSTYFGWYFHSSSGVHTTVSTASGICHTVTAICRYRGRVGTNWFECAVGGVLTMHVLINVKSSNNISKWQMEFNSAFKGLMSTHIALN